MAFQSVYQSLAQHGLSFYIKAVSLYFILACVPYNTQVSTISQCTRTCKCKSQPIWFSFHSILGEKRFQTIQDLVADGLITMFIDTYAKDYVDTMMISPVKSEEKKDTGKDETKENEPDKKATEQEDGAVKDQVFNTVFPNFYVTLFLSLNLLFSFLQF